jgi:hypothetical protein
MPAETVGSVERKHPIHVTGARAVCSQSLVDVLIRVTNIPLNAATKVGGEGVPFLAQLSRLADN